MSTTSLTRLMLAPGFAQTQSAGEKSWWPRPERHRCVCSEETRRQPSPSGSYRRTVLTAATESSARPSCRIVTVVGPPPSGEDTADVDVRAREVRRAEWIDDDVDTFHVQLVVALLGAAVETERVLEARAPTALDGDPQDRGLAVGLLGHQVPDLRRCALGQSDESRLL